jgi:bifunctional UDP-N-acetylglucosamine pyrophosphorylase/glucosamine-1-phosphate N-acetyltransferase
MQAIILAAGKSTRCFPLTVTTPKPLLPVANKPLIMYHLDSLVGLVKEVIIVIGYNGIMIRKALEGGYRGIRIKYFEQNGIKGTGDAMRQVAPLIKDRFMVISGDDFYLAEDIRKLAKHENCVLVSECSEPQLFGVVEHTKGRVSRIIEKPAKPKSKLVNAAAYVFERGMIESLKKIKRSPRGELEFTDAVNIWAKGHKVGYQVAKKWLGLSHSWKLLDANAEVLSMLPKRIEGIVEPRATVKGKLILGKNSVVKNGVYIEGDVIIGENSVVGPNCYIRGPVAIGQGCKVGNAIEVKNSILMDGATVGHLSYVGDSILGCHVNFGAGTITANLRHDNSHVKSVVKGELVDTGRRKLGAIVGDYVHTGIHTSIYPGRKLWPNTMTKPGEIVDKDITE